MKKVDILSIMISKNHLKHTNMSIIINHMLTIALKTLNNFRQGHKIHQVNIKVEIEIFESHNS